MIYKMPFPYWEQISNRVYSYPVRTEYDDYYDSAVEQLIEQDYGLRYTGRQNIPEGQKEWDIWEETYDYEVVDHLKFHRNFAWFVLNFKED